MLFCWCCCSFYSCCNCISSITFHLSQSKYYVELGTGCTECIEKHRTLSRSPSIKKSKCKHLLWMWILHFHFVYRCCCWWSLLFLLLAFVVLQFFFQWFLLFISMPKSSWINIGVCMSLWQIDNNLFLSEKVFCEINLAIGRETETHSHIVLMIFRHV